MVALATATTTQAPAGQQQYPGLNVVAWTPQATLTTTMTMMMMMMMMTTTTATALANVVGFGVRACLASVRPGARQARQGVTIRPTRTRSPARQSTRQCYLTALVPRTTRTILALATTCLRRQRPRQTQRWRQHLVRLSVVCFDPLRCARPGRLKQRSGNSRPLGRVGDEGVEDAFALPRVHGQQVVHGPVVLAVVGETANVLPVKSVDSFDGGEEGVVHVVWLKTPEGSVVGAQAHARQPLQARHGAKNVRQSLPLRINDNDTTKATQLVDGPGVNVPRTAGPLGHGERR
mmetsp:Transcript_8841/g.28239  ORF Transcript_8841/g.28239 Transcript_8841/m.28239 type:complete len:291 (+) Transcript_8841:840-1712(+)